ncbi:MAG: alpha-galactosidase [Treponema sp.]|nr:alpha-galactosidase [Treponema sp.]
MPHSKDAYFETTSGEFVIGTGKVEKTIALTDGGAFYLKSYLDKTTGKNMAEFASMLSDEFSATVNGELICGNSGGFVLAGTESKILAQGELEATVTLKKEDLVIERHYVAYPETAIIQEWTVYGNNSDQVIRITRPSLFIQRILHNDRQDEDFLYMTGGANFTGSCTLKSIPLTEGLIRDFDSRGKPEMSEIDGRYINEWHPRMNGTGVWFEFFGLRNRKSNIGWFLNFDYQGWWKAGFTNRDGNTALTGWCELIDYPLKPGETMCIAPAMIGISQGDLDDMGNDINDYIYTYKWDYTRDTYFNRTNMSIWREAPLKEKVFKMVEAARYIGCERLWVDDFWFDAKGNYNPIFGDDFKDLNSYLKANSLLFRLWMPPWHADRLSQVWLDHPDWMLDFHGNWYNWTIDMSKEEAYQWILNMLNNKQKQFGVYDLRVDGDPVMMWNDGSWDTQEQGSWNGSFKQSENFYRLYKEFKDANPDAGIDGCSSGGHTLTIESVRYVDQQQITDGHCEHMGGYWTTMIMPIDKHQGMPMGGHRRRNWHEYDLGLANFFSAPGESMQNPEKGWSDEALEGHRKEMELFYWLRAQGIYGRYVKVYRPTLTYGDPTFILQRMTKDQRKGMVMISGHHLNPILGKYADIFPKGLLPHVEYLVESLRGGIGETAKNGREWMEQGIHLDNVLPGEILFLNLYGRPGQGTDTQPPTAPSDAKAGKAHWLGLDGIGVQWGHATDNVMVSYYEIIKNGKPCTKVSTGCYYFDTAGVIGDSYQIYAVDGDGNKSASVTAIVEN